MARDESHSGPVARPPLFNPWPPLQAGLVLVLLAWALTDSMPVPACVGLLVAGVLLTGFGLNQRAGASAPTAPEKLPWYLRLVAPDGLPVEVEGVYALLLGAVTAFIASAACAAWDTMALVFRVLTGLGLAGALLVVLPSLVRKVVLVALVVVHFGGIFTAVVSVPPPGQPSLWLGSQVWARFYRPYLEFMYLNNAYHFYSPEPGPAILLWCHVEYANGDTNWVKLPNREQFPTRLGYQRRLALTEHMNHLNASIEPAEHLIEARGLAAQGRLPGKPRIPAHPQRAPHLQFRVPGQHSEFMVRSYARHVALHTPHPSDPSIGIRGVKVYRVVHNILGPKDLLTNDPTDPTTYDAYYQGEFDADGKLKKAADPMRYWLIPVFRSVEQGNAQFRTKRMPDSSSPIEDYLEIHAKLWRLDE